MLKRLISCAAVAAAALAVAAPANATVYNYKPSAPMLPSTSANTSDGYVYRSRNALNHPYNTTFRLRLWVSGATICTSGCYEYTAYANTDFYITPLWAWPTGTVGQCSNLSLNTWTASCWTIQ